MTTSEARYRLEAISGCTIISLLPDLNNVQWADIEQVGTNALAQLEKSRTPALLVDLSELEYMGSAMVALIVRLWKAVQKRDGRMVVVNRHQLVFEVLKLAGLHTVWTIVETRGEAFKQLRIHPAGGDDEGGGGGGVLLMGILAVIGAVAGLLLILSPDKIVDDKVALAIELGSSAFGLIVGTIIAARHAGLRQGFGILVIVASLAVIAVGIVKRPDSFTPAPRQGDKAGSKSDKSDSKAKGSDSKTKGPATGTIAATKSTPETKPATKPSSSTKPETKPTAKPDPSAKPTPKPKSTTEPKPKPVTKPNVPVKPKPTPKLKPAVNSKAIPAPKP